MENQETGESGTRAARMFLLESFRARPFTDNLGALTLLSSYAYRHEQSRTHSAPHSHVRKRAILKGLKTNEGQFFPTFGHSKNIIFRKRKCEFTLFAFHFFSNRLAEKTTHALLRNPNLILGPQSISFWQEQGSTGGEGKISSKC